jgi:hypothetical protein
MTKKLGMTHVPADGAWRGFRCAKTIRLQQPNPGTIQKLFRCEVQRNKRAFHQM